MLVGCELHVRSLLARVKKWYLQTALCIHSHYLVKCNKFTNFQWTCRYVWHSHHMFSLCDVQKECRKDLDEWLRLYLIKFDQIWIKRDQLDVTCFIILLFTAQHVLDVLTSETCWAVNNEIIKQVTSSWSLFIQLSRWGTVQ